MVHDIKPFWFIALPMAIHQEIFWFTAFPMPIYQELFCFTVASTHVDTMVKISKFISIIP
jgi:hypothetical protein